MTQGIRRGISLYSFQDDYFEGRRDLEGCIAAAAELGATGIETLGEQMMPGFPNLPESFYATYAGWMEKYGTVSVAHDLFLDTKKFKGRMMTPDEMVASLRIDIDHTAKLGATSIRVIVNTPPDMVEAVAGYARDKGVKLGVEIHAPFSFDHPWIKQHLEVADRYPGTVGCVPDLGIFVARFPRVVMDRAIRDGADPALAASLARTYDEHGDTRARLAELEAAGSHPADIGLARTMTHYIWSDPKALTDHAAYINHVHAKFYEMTPEGEEYSIPYPEIIAALGAAGWSGYLDSEYEGNRHVQDIQQVDAYGQLRLHQDMMARCIADQD